MLIILSFIIVIIVGAFFLGYIQIEQIHNHYIGDFLILRIQNNNKKPYRAFECQHSNDFFIRCNFIEVLENADYIRGPQ